MAEPARDTNARRAAIDTDLQKVRGAEFASKRPQYEEVGQFGRRTVQDDLAQKTLQRNPNDGTFGKRTNAQKEDTDGEDTVVQTEERERKIQTATRLRQQQKLRALFKKKGGKMTAKAVGRLAGKSWTCIIALIFSFFISLSSLFGIIFLSNAIDASVLFEAAGFNSTLATIASVAAKGPGAIVASLSGLNLLSAVTGVSTETIAQNIAMAFFALSTILGLVGFLIFGLWFMLTGRELINSVPKALISFIAMGVGILPVVNIFPVLVLWVVYVEYVSFIFESEKT